MLSTGESARRWNSRRLLVGVLVFFALVAATGVVWFYALGAKMPLPGFDLSAEVIEAEIRALGMWGVAFVILLMVLHSFVPFPAEIVAIAAGMCYGLWWGSLITWVGAMLGAYLAFGLARWFGRPFVLAVVAERHHAAVDRWTARQGGGALLVSRFVPVISFNLINYAAGLTNVSWWTFTWATGAGILPLTFLMVLMGDSMWSEDSLVWLWLLAASIAGLLGWFLMNHYRRKSRRP